MASWHKRLSHICFCCVSAEQKRWIVVPPAPQRSLEVLPRPVAVHISARGITGGHKGQAFFARRQPSWEIPASRTQNPHEKEAESVQRFRGITQLLPAIQRHFWNKSMTKLVQPRPKKISVGWGEDNRLRSTLHKHAPTLSRCANFLAISRLLLFENAFFSPKLSLQRLSAICTCVYHFLLWCKFWDWTEARFHWRPQNNTNRRGALA